MVHFQPSKRRSAPKPAAPPAPTLTPSANRPSLTSLPAPTRPALHHARKNNNAVQSPRFGAAPHPQSVQRALTAAHNALPEGVKSDLNSLYNTLEFLVQYRPQELQQFVRSTMLMYNRDFSHSRRGRPHTPGPSTPGARTPTTPNLQPTHLPPPHHQRPFHNIPVLESDADPPPIPSHIRPTQNADPPPARPHLRSAPHPPNRLPIPASRSPDDVISKQASSPPLPTHPPHPFYERRIALANAVAARYKSFINANMETNVPMNPEKDSYVISKTTQQGNSNPVLLKADILTNTPLLQDSSKQLPVAYARALHFLWLSMVSSRCTGAVFHRTIGLPVMHIVFIFCHLYLQTCGKKKKKKILIISPSCNWPQWHATARALLHLLQVSFLDAQTATSTFGEWNDVGGILVCNFDHYEKIMLSEDCDDRKDAIISMVDPGPDIIILDEASRLATFHPTVQRMIARTSTKSRLALTSSSFTSNLFRTWSIADWATPELFGTREEFCNVFLNKIIVANRKNSSRTDKDIALKLARHFYSKLTHVSHSLDVEHRKDLLRLQGKRLSETKILVNISECQARVYNTITEFFNRALKSGKISSYVVAHVLLVTCSSLDALVQLLKDGPNEGLDACKDSEIGRSMKNVETIFAELLELVKPLIQEDEISSKLLVTKEIVMRCTAAGEKVVIFTSFSQTWSVVHNALKQVCPDNTVQFDVSEDPDTRRKKLEYFNKSQTSAVFVAPLGSGLNCAEAAGWGHVNANRVIIFDSCWDAAAISQAINRVFGYTALSAVHVYHVLCAGTFESVMQTSTNVLIPDVTQNESQFVGMAKPQNYLIAPDFDHGSLVANAVVTEQASSINSNRETEDINRQITLEDDNVLSIDELRALRRDEEMLVINSITSKGSIYQMGTEGLEIFLQSSTDPKKNNVQDTTYVAMDILKAANSITKDQPPIDVREKFIDLNIVKDLFVELKSKDGSLLACWDPYFRLYELPPKRAALLKSRERTIPKMVDNRNNGRQDGRQASGYAEHRNDDRMRRPSPHDDRMPKNAHKRDRQGSDAHIHPEKRARSNTRDNREFGSRMPPHHRDEPSRPKHNEGPAHGRGRGRGRELTIPAWKRNTS